MKNKLSSKKSLILCLSWSVIGIILLCLIFFTSSLKDPSLEKIMGNIVLGYVFLSCILVGIVAYIKKGKK